MRTTVCNIGISLFAVFFCLSCGGGGSGGSGIGDLQGTWYGVIEDDEGEAGTLSLELDSSGNMVDVQIGGVSIDDTGHLNDDWDENLFHVLYDHGLGHNNPFLGGVMIVDDSAQCAIFADRDIFFAILEKGATSLPSYAASDIVGSYIGGGYEFAYDASSGSWNWGGENVSMTVDPDLDFTGTTDSDTFTGTFDSILHSMTYGGYSGTLTRDSGLPKDLLIDAVVSPGKNCAAAWAWESGTSPTSLEDYILIGLVK